MRDVCDRAQERIEIDLAQALHAQRVRATNTQHLAPNGFCHNPRCGEDFGLDAQKLFCGPACAAEYERVFR